MRGGRRLIVLALCLGGLAVSAGCRKKLAFDRWEALRLGDSRAHVKSVLGKPLEEQPQRLIYTDADRGIAADLWFDPRSQALLYTEWCDPTHGMRAKGARPDR